VRRSTPSPELLRLIAERFKVLAEPARLEILSALRAGEMTVSELVDATGLGQANVSKHLRLLLAHGFVRRRKDASDERCSSRADVQVDERCAAQRRDPERSAIAALRFVGSSVTAVRNTTASPMATAIGGRCRTPGRVIFP
jgi:DNA-binding transcriptional ArsR family regulator